MTAIPATSDAPTPEDRSIAPRDRVCARLCDILRNGADVHRTVAAQALGTIGRPDGVPALLDALLDEDPDVRVDAAAALGRIGDPAAAPKLMDNLLGDPCAEVKLAAIDGLIAMRHEPLVPWLIRLLKGRDEEIAWDEDEIYQDGWDDWIDIQVKAIDGLARFGAAQAVPDIVEALDDEFGQDLCAVGFAALARLGNAGAGALIGYLDGKDRRLGRRAAAALATSDTPGAQDAVSRALASPSPDIRGATLRALSAHDPGDPRLAELLVDRRPALRAETIRLLGHLYPARVAILLRDSDRDVQQAALELMAREPKPFDGEQLRDLLRTRLQSESVTVGAAALKAVAALLGEDALPDVLAAVADRDLPPARRLAAIAALATIGGEHAIAGFAAVLGDRERQVRLDAMAQLASFARLEAWPNPAGFTLLAALRGELIPEPEEPPEEPVDDAEEAETEDQPVADVMPTSTLQAILNSEQGAQTTGDEAEPVLTQEDEEFLALSRSRAMRKNKVSPNPEVAPHRDVRMFAARVLGDVPQADVANALALVLADDDEDVRRSAVDSLARIAAKLGRLPATAMDALKETAAGGDRDLRLYATRAIANVGDAACQDLLRNLLEDEDGFVRAEAVRGLSALLEDAEILEPLLTDEDPGVREAAARAIAAAGAPGAIGQLVDFAFFREGFHKEMAARLLRFMDAGAANTRFLDVLGDRDRMRVWLIAMVALAELNRPTTDTARPNGGAERRRIETS